MPISSFDSADCVQFEGLQAIPLLLPPHSKPVAAKAIASQHSLFAQTYDHFSTVELPARRTSTHGPARCSM
jgi:hypothetical protein